jgi:hypothetical protein
LFPRLFKKVHWEKLGFEIQGSSTSFANTFGYLKLCISSLSFIWLLPSQDQHAIPWMTFLGFLFSGFLLLTLLFNSLKYC